MPKALGILNHKPISVRQHLQMFLLGLVNQNRSGREGGGRGGGGPKILVCDKTIWSLSAHVSSDFMQNRGGVGQMGPGGEDNSKRSYRVSRIYPIYHKVLEGCLDFYFTMKNKNHCTVSLSI